ncbi:AaceriAAR081Cp [[Ashbya] aceris (nom. inval.)]|nr:AaceriAAR081Cp [[Ashbya] aceris (nom. inval.)]
MIAASIQMDAPAAEPYPGAAALLQAVRGSVAEQLDAWRDYACALLVRYHDAGYAHASLAVEAARAVLHMAACYELLAQELAERAYDDESAVSEAWRSSTTMGKRAIGLAVFLRRLDIPPTAADAALRDTYQRVWVLDQQVRVLILAVAKMQRRLGGNRYDELLTLQEGDPEKLLENAQVYGRLAQGCAQECRRLGGSAVEQQAAQLGVFLEAMALALFSVGRYEHGDCGVALGMVEAAEEQLVSGGIAPREYLGMLRDPRRQARQARLRSKLQQLRQRMRRRPAARLHPFVQRVADEFLTPLVVLLRYRYERANETLYMQPVVRQWQLPQGRLPGGGGHAVGV